MVGCSGIFDLAKYVIHDPRRQENFFMRERHRRFACEGIVERCNKGLQASVVRQVEVSLQESTEVLAEIAEVLLCVAERRDEVSQVALIIFVDDLDEDLMIVVDDQGILAAIEPKLMRRGTDLGRENEVGGRLSLVPDEDPDLVDDPFFSDALQEGTRESVGDHFGPVAGQELRDLADPVADDILEEGARQLPHPMIFVAEKGLGKPRVRKIVTVLAFHVDRLAAQIAALDQFPHADHGMRELGIMPGDDLEPLVVSEPYQFLCLGRIQREWLLHIDVAAGLQAHLSQLEVALRRRRDVDDIGLDRIEHLPSVPEISLDMETIGHLLGHQRLGVAYADDPCFGDPLDLEGMLIRHLPATDYADLDHLFLLSASRI